MMIRSTGQVRTSAVLACAAGMLCSTVSAQQAEFIGLGNLGGGGYAQARALSLDGSTVVGFTTVPEGGFRAFKWTAADGMVALGSLHENNNTDAFGVSADGSVVVGGGRIPYLGFPSGGNEPFRWTESTGMVGLGHLSAVLGGQANGVSADGSVVVGLTLDSGNRPFRWTEATGMVSLGGHPGSSNNANARNISPDGTVIVGVGTNSEGRTEAWRWTSDTGVVGIGRLPGPFANPNAGSSSAAAISADNSTIVGTGIGEFGQAEGFRWTESTGIQGLGIPFALATEARAVSGDGSIVVGELTYDFDEELTWAIIDRGNGFELLADVLTIEYGVDLGFWELASAVGISEDGRVIAGWGYWSGDVSSLDWEPFIVRLPGPCLGDIADGFGLTADEGGGPDGIVDFGDFAALLGLIGPCAGGAPGCVGDIADDFGLTADEGGGPDGIVDFGDFAALLGLIGPCS